MLIYNEELSLYDLEVSFGHASTATAGTGMCLINEVPLTNIENPEPYLVFPYCYEHRLLRAHNVAIPRTFVAYLLVSPYDYKTHEEGLQELLAFQSKYHALIADHKDGTYTLIMPIETDPLTFEQYDKVIDHISVIGGAPDFWSSVPLREVYVTHEFIESDGHLKHVIKDTDYHEEEEIEQNQE